MKEYEAKETRLTKAYFKRNPVEDISAARLWCSCALQPDVERYAEQLVREEGFLPDGTDEERERIQNTVDPDALLRLLRGKVCAANAPLLREKLLACEDLILPELQRRFLTSQIDTLIENGARIFVECKADVCDWLLTQYNAIRNPYARCLACIVLGMRTKDPGIVPFLMEQVDALKAACPDKDYDQGPLLALHELDARFEIV